MMNNKKIDPRLSEITAYVISNFNNNKLTRLRCKKNNIRLTANTVLPTGAVEIGIVRGACVISGSIVSDVLTCAVNMTVGGELKPYSRLLSKSVDKAIERMCEQADKKGATGVYAIQFVAPQVAGGAAEIIAIGMAYKIGK